MRRSIRELLKNGMGRLLGRRITDDEYADAMALEQNADVLVPINADLIEGRGERWVKVWMQLREGA